MKTHRKFVLCAIFGFGIFVVLCAILNKYYDFAETGSDDWIHWYIREASTAVIVANIPGCWPLVHRIPILNTLLSDLPVTTAKNSSSNHPHSSQAVYSSRKNEGSNLGEKGNSTVVISSESEEYDTISEVQLEHWNEDERAVKSEKNVAKKESGETSKEDWRNTSQSFLTTAV
jgi:hypothetical protein